jgi:hypothetical protein
MTPEERFDTALSDLKQASDNYVQAIIESRRLERKSVWRRREQSLRVPSLIMLGMACGYSIMGYHGAFTAAMVIAGVMILARVFCTVAERRQR